MSDQGSFELSDDLPDTSDLSMEVATAAEGDLSSGGRPDHHDVNLTLREVRAVQLRSAGATYDQIADALQYETRSGAYRAVRRALQRWGSESVDELRVLELQRLDQITQKLWPQVMGKPAQDHGDGNITPPVPPDMKAMDVYLRVSARRAKLLGLDAPTEVDLLGGHVQSEGDRTVADFEALQALVGQLAEMQVEDAELVDEDGSDSAGDGDSPTPAGDPVLPARPNGQAG